MAVGHTWAAFSRDAGLNVSGPLPIIKASGVVRHLGVDACQLDTPYSPDAYGRLAPGRGLVLYRDGRQVFSGMVGTERRIKWDAGSGGQATISVQFLGDDQHLADRLVFPTPSQEATGQTDDYWTYTGPASSAMWNLINQQAGPAAYTGPLGAGTRVVPGLTMGADPAVGVNRTWAEQWANLLDTLTLWGIVSGADLGVRIVSVGGSLRADLYVPRDLSAGVRFSASLANLTGWEHVQTPPTATYVVAAGAGDLHLRQRLIAKTGSGADLTWGRRIEKLLDQRQESDTTKLAQVAADELAQSHGVTSLSVSPIDSTLTRWGTDYDLGDKVTVHVGLPGGPTAATVIDLVREIAFDVNAAGVEKITPAVGTSDAKAIRPGPTQQALADVATGLARLTRNK